MCLFSQWAEVVKMMFPCLLKRSVRKHLDSDNLLAHVLFFFAMSRSGDDFRLSLKEILFYISN